MRFLARLVFFVSLYTIGYFVTNSARPSQPIFDLFPGRTIVAPDTPQVTDIDTDSDTDTNTDLPTPPPLRPSDYCWVGPVKNSLIHYLHHQPQTINPFIYCEPLTFCLPRQLKLPPLDPRLNWLHRAP